MKATFGAGGELKTQNLEASMLKFRYHVTTWESRDKNVPKSKKTKEKTSRGDVNLSSIRTRLRVIEIYSKYHFLFFHGAKYWTKPVKSFKGYYADEAHEALRSA